MRDYLWASPVGRIRIIEKGLLTRSDLSQILDAGNLETALMTLRDSFYGPYVSKLEDASFFETALKEAVKDAHDSMMKLAPEPMVLAAYRARYDFHNLKVLLKAQLLGVPDEPGAFSELGNLSLDHLKEILTKADQGESISMWFEQEPDPRTESAYEVSLEIAGTYRQVAKGDALSGLSPFEVDSWIDKSYYGWAESVYRKYGYPALIEFIKSEIDIVNLKMAIRAKLLGISGTDFGNIVLLGGNIKPVKLAEAYLGDYQDIAGVYKGTQLENLAKQGVLLAEQKQSLTKWEKQCDNTVVEIVREAGSVCLGPEPVFGYVFGREIEVKNLRIILSGKQSLIPENEISERLRESYV